MKIAAVQMSSRADLKLNIVKAEQLIKQAVGSGAECVLLPEYFYSMAAKDSDRLALAEAFLDGPIQIHMAALAKEYAIWLIAGTLPIKSEQPDKFFNSQLVYSPSGECVCRYDKVHLFGFDNGNEAYCESDTMAAGSEIKTFQLAEHTVRPSICYDLRFPEFYRHDAGFDLITAPAAFTYTTGKAHWKTLLTCRAIENQCYVIAAAQVGEHENGSRTYGHSMIINPWGEVLDCLPEGEGFVCAELDMNDLNEKRQQLPALKNRVFF